MILNETSYFGAGCRETIAVEAARRGFKKAFFVTDRDLIRFKVADKVIEVFEKNSIPYELFSDVKANPTITNVQNGVAAFKASGADFIVALGGGSSIDTAKGIGIVVNNPDFEYVACLHVPEYKGQEVTRFLQTVLGFQSLEQFKKNTEVYACLNYGERSYRVMIQKIQGKDKFVQNTYSVKKKNFEITISRTDVKWELLNRKGSNMEEFFDVIDW